MQIKAVFTTHGDERKTHLLINGVDMCATPSRYPNLLWDNGGAIAQSSVDLIAKGINPGNRICKWCMRRAKAHLTTFPADRKERGG